MVTSGGRASRTTPIRPSTGTRLRKSGEYVESDRLPHLSLLCGQLEFTTRPRAINSPRRVIGRNTFSKPLVDRGSDGYPVRTDCGAISRRASPVVGQLEAS